MHRLVIVCSTPDAASLERLQAYLHARVPGLRTLTPGVFFGYAEPRFACTDLAGDADYHGEPFAGLAPGTKVYVIRAEGEPELLFDSAPRPPWTGS